MLRYAGKPPDRRSRWDVGVEVGGCNLQPGPGSCYLNGDDMQATARGLGATVESVVIGYKGVVRFVVLCVLLW